MDDTDRLCEKALVVELLKRGHRVDQQRRFQVHYDGHVIKERSCPTSSSTE